ncbi:MAG: thioesterase family protein [Bacteroidales bacterium]
MEINIPLNTVLTKKIIVQSNDTAKVYGSGTLDVFATPAMIALMENVAYNAIQAFLPNGMGSVGISIHAEHIKASPVGTQIECTASVEKIEGRKVFFKIHANDEHAEIGTATHLRYIVNNMDFMQKIQNKK